MNATLSNALDVRNLSVRYGNILGLESASLSIAPDEIVVVLGANGAGKTSLLNGIAGVIPCASGTIDLYGSTVTSSKASEVVRHGVTLVPEGRCLFAPFTVEANLRLGCYSRRRSLHSRADWNRELERVFDIFPILRDRRKQLAGSLSGGQQQMLAIARALLSHPRLLLLDEPSNGLAPQTRQEIFDVLAELHSSESIAILMVEQDAEAALAIADRGYILDNGRIALSGSSTDLRASEQVRAVYFGGAT